MNEFIKLKGISEKELIKVLNINDELDRQITDNLLDEIIDYVNTYSDGEHIHKIEEMPNLPGGFMGMMIPSTKYFINIRRSTLVIIGIGIDFLLANRPSIGTGLMTLSGFMSKSIHELDNDELEILQSIRELTKKQKQAPSAQEIYFDVQKRSKSVKFNYVDKLLDNLLEKDVIKKDNNRYTIRL